MYWKMIGSLWILGFLLEIASFMDLFSGRDVWVWSAYGLSCAVIIARQIPERQFNHTSLTGLIVGGTLWLAVVQSTPHYPSGMGGFELFSIRLLAPVTGVCGGLALMLLTWLASILVGNRR